VFLELSESFNVLSFSEVCPEDMSPEDISSDRLSFYRFDISRLLKHGASLLGSAGVEFEVQDDKSGRIRSWYVNCSIVNYVVNTILYTWSLFKFCCVTRPPPFVPQASIMSKDNYRKELS